MGLNTILPASLKKILKKSLIKSRPDFMYTKRKTKKYITRIFFRYINNKIKKH